MRQDATVHLNVEDTGMGMPPEHMTRIFEPLYTTKPGGTGLAAYRAGGRRRAWWPGGRAEYRWRRHHLYDHAASRWDVRETGGDGKWPRGVEGNEDLPTLPQSGYMLPTLPLRHASKI